MTKSSKGIQNATANVPQIAYVSMDGVNQTKGLEALNGATEEFCAVEKTTGSLHWLNYQNLDTNTAGRPGLTKSDYYRFRPGEAPPSPRDIKEIIRRADECYAKVGIIRNVIDLMGDFACQGIRVVHPNKRIERFFKNWFDKVGGPERSERFCNNLLRTGNVVVRKNTAKITAQVEETLYKAVGAEEYRATGKPDMDIPIIKTIPREIPFKYTYLEPSTIDVVGGPLSTFVGQPLHVITIPFNIRKLILSPRSDEEYRIINGLPLDIVNAAKASKPYLLPPEKTRVFHYKKDDWQIWAYPMIYSIFDDVAMLQKLRLADMAALDGAISNIRIFKIGSLKYKIAPSKTAAAKLSQILQNNVGGGTIDLIWGPDIELMESKTTVHQFLGSEKYKPCLEALYMGLGIPPSLIGTGGTGTTNNFIALKTLVQRLQYCRGILLSFWKQELLEVQRAMGFRFPAKIEFDMDILDDEHTVKALLVQLSDRNLISDEALQRRFGHDPEMESIRIAREEKARNDGDKTQKAGPFHDAQFGYALKKMALQAGVITAGQAGLTPDNPIFDLGMGAKGKGEKTALEMRMPPKDPTMSGKQNKDATTPTSVVPPFQSGKSPAIMPKQVKTTMVTQTKFHKGVPQQGRPKNSKDTTKRATKTFKPKLRANVEVWTKNAQAFIGDTINNIYLNTHNKKNMRTLNYTEARDVEKLKFGVLFNIDPLAKLDENIVCAALGEPIDAELYQQYQIWANEISISLDRPLTFDELKQIQITLYSEAFQEIEVEEEGEDNG